MRYNRMFLNVSVINRRYVFFVSANDNKGGDGGEQHEKHKRCTHGDELRKDAGKQFSGKGTYGVKHKEGAVKASLDAVGNVGLGCGNADVIRSDTEDSDDETSDHHRDKRSIKIERFHKSDGDIDKKRDAEFSFRGEFCEIVDDSAEASSDNAENRNEHEGVFAVFKSAPEPGKSDDLGSSADEAYNHKIEGYGEKTFFGNKIAHALFHIAEISFCAVMLAAERSDGGFNVGNSCFKNRRDNEENRVNRKKRSKPESIICKSCKREHEEGHGLKRSGNGIGF